MKAPTPVRPASLLPLAALWLGLLLPDIVLGNPIDLLGLSSKAGGRADAATASCSGGECLYYNPGRLAFGTGFSLFGGLQGQTSSFTLPSGSVAIHDALYAHMGLSFALPFKGFLKDRIRAGVLLSSPVNEIGYIRMHLPSDPFYPYFENRTQRLILVPGVSFLLYDSPSLGRFGLGFGINYFAGLDGAIIGYEGATRSVEARVFEEVGGRFATTLGLSWERGRFAVGVSYRQAFGVSFQNVSFNHVAGTDINIDLEAQSLYSPHTITYGFSYRAPNYSLHLDLSEYLWSYYRSPFVAMESQLPLVGDLAGELPEASFNNTFGARLGGVYHLNSDLKLSLGLSFEQAMVGSQEGVSNLLDGHKLGFSTGLSYAFNAHLHLHAHLRLVALIGETHTKRALRTDEECGTIHLPQGGDALMDEIPCVADDPTTTGFQTSNPGYPSITSGGYMLSGGVTLEVRR